MTDLTIYFAQIIYERDKLEFYIHSKETRLDIQNLGKLEPYMKLVEGFYVSAVFNSSF